MDMPDKQAIMFCSHVTVLKSCECASACLPFNATFLDNVVQISICMF